MLVDGVDAFNRRMIAPQTRDTARAVGKLTPAAYKQEAVAAVVRLTRQRVTSFASSHDRDTDVATEIFTLEPSLSQRRAPHRAASRKRLATPTAGLNFRTLATSAGSGMASMFLMNRTA